MLKKTFLELLRWSLRFHGIFHIGMFIQILLLEIG